MDIKASGCRVTSSAQLADRSTDRSPGKTQRQDYSKPPPSRCSEMMSSSSRPARALRAVYRGAGNCRLVKTLLSEQLLEGVTCAARLSGGAALLPRYKQVSPTTCRLSSNCTT